MRYLPLNDADRATMLGRIGVDNIDALFSDVPATARLDGPAKDGGAPWVPPRRGRRFDVIDSTG